MSVDAHPEQLLQRLAGAGIAHATGNDRHAAPGAPALCAALLGALLPTPAETLDVLDAGCGEGACGSLLQPYARELTGVDRAPARLAVARERGGYDALQEAELTAWLAGHPATYDLVVAADVLRHFGDLHGVLRAAATALRPFGQLLFTVQEAPGASVTRYLLQPNGRYSHAEAHVRGALDAAGFTVAVVSRITLGTQQQGQQLQRGGLLVAAFRRSA
ncbi:methyltransferase family protein [Pseudoduganella lurida]|uniref:Methyltransferase family protein n=1 Tax=Pseudoduganella lurida TaxID=1036180 RepID=A0A562RK28_9BURK|nr:methyltransferase domain-containing protein [Pseudoduganella lurida]TWI69398.1 methyltransferase family protein [Pseudoduganella lurida]